MFQSDGHNGSEWFRLENLPWMIEHWAALTAPYCRRVHEDRLDDSFTLKQIGREGAWRLLMMNRRAEGTPHAGGYSFSTTLTTGEKLLSDLRALAKSQGL